jgi:cell division protein FtsI/penicillin-binding protein 2
LRFYVAHILSLTPREIGALRRRVEADGGEEPWCVLAARVRGTTPASLVASVERRAEESRDDLRLLAEMLAGEGVLGDETAAITAPTDRLVALLDERRADLEDAAADELFQTACGFSPGRLPTESLRDTFDLTWIERALRWDAARLATWTATRRANWEASLDEFLLPRILARADLGRTEAERAQRLLDGLADLWRAGSLRARNVQPWTDLDELTVLHEARSLFRSPAGDVPRDDGALVLPFQDPAIRSQSRADEDPWLAVGRLFESAAVRVGRPTPSAEEIANRWSELSTSGPGFDGEPALEELRRVAREFEAAYGASVARTMSALRRSETGAGAATPPLELVHERIDRARQRERYVLVDAQSRATRIAPEPEYALAQLVARDPDRYAGFAVRSTTRRVARVLDAQGVPAAGLWIGAIRQPFLRELVAQSEDERRLASLKERILISDEEEREIRELSERIDRADEWTGDRGLEAWFDQELRGRAGTWEAQGLDAERRGDGVRLEPAIDGKDIVLTLDAGLQVAAQDVLAHPRRPESGRTDETFLENPVGAIVLLAPDGEILAAASEPMLPGHPNVTGRGYERSRPRERTAQTPTFNPPGSVFKPFVAAYALDRLGFDPATRFPCVLDATNRPAFESLHCSALHYESDLHHALVVSCNAYFAQLGLRFEPRQLLEAAHEFGFGEPTGVRYASGPGRRGLREDWVASPDFDDAGMLKQLENRRALLGFSNGLGLLWASPLQVARATAALATGALPDLRIVRRIGDAAVESTSRPLAISRASLDIVRAAMRGVVVESGGSAHNKGVDDATLGFSFACKTGSGDIGAIHDVPGMPEDDRAAGAAGKSRKHTWIAGWFPAEEPVAIVVVYLHNVTETASHTAIHVAAQYLQSDAVRELVARRGAQ